MIRTILIALLFLPALVIAQSSSNCLNTCIGDQAAAEACTTLETCAAACAAGCDMTPQKAVAALNPQEMVKKQEPAIGEKMNAGPCADPLYLKLKKKEIEAMTDREFEIFKTQSEACSQYQASVASTSGESDTAEAIRKASHSYVSAILLISVISLGVYVATVGEY